MKPLPLRLALDPLLPSRTPKNANHFEYGYRLRLPGGPEIEHTDRLLTAFGASVEWLCVGPEHEEALQADAFDPGRFVRLASEPFDPYDPEAIGVWDADGIRQAGTLPCDVAATVFAAAEAGLEQRGLALCEDRAVSDDRRERVALLVHSPRLVRVTVPRTPRFERLPRATRPRLVLVADGSGDVRWWDPSATAGPLDAADVPLSDELRRELEHLRDAFAALTTDADPQRGFDRLEQEWERAELHGQAASLWRRARTELGRRYAIGFLGSGMRRPVWSPSELDDDDEDPDSDIPF